MQKSPKSLVAVGSCSLRNLGNPTLTRLRGCDFCTRRSTRTTSISPGRKWRAARTELKGRQGIRPTHLHRPRPRHHLRHPQRPPSNGERERVGRDPEGGRGGPAGVGRPDPPQLLLQPPPQPCPPIRSSNKDNPLPLEHLGHTRQPWSSAWQAHWAASPNRWFTWAKDNRSSWVPTTCPNRPLPKYLINQPPLNWVPGRRPHSMSSSRASNTSSPRVTTLPNKLLLWRQQPSSAQHMEQPPASTNIWCNSSRLITTSTLTTSMRRGTINSNSNTWRTSNSSRNNSSSIPSTIWIPSQTCFPCPLTSRSTSLASRTSRGKLLQLRQLFSSSISGSSSITVEEEEGRSAPAPSCPPCRLVLPPLNLVSLSSRARLQRSQICYQITECRMQIGWIIWLQSETAIEMLSVGRNKGLLNRVHPRSENENKTIRRKLLGQLGAEKVLQNWHWRNIKPLVIND